MNIKFSNLKIADFEMRKQLDTAYHRVMDSGWYILGKEVALFEKEFATYCQSKNCIGVANGLEAIHLILKAHGIGRDDEVLVPANTFIATWLAVSHVGAIPVAVEPNEVTYNISAEGIIRNITPKTKAIIVVHLYGQPANMEEINECADKFGIPVIEDACQAQGANFKSKMTGSLGTAAAFSFYPAKNMGGYGDGGAVTTSDTKLADRIRLLRNYGSPAKYQHVNTGYNSRLDELQAAFLRVKLKYLNSHNNIRKCQASIYRELLREIPGIKLPVVEPGSDSVWHQFVVKVDKRDELSRCLQAQGIETMIHYPVPPHKSKAYSSSHGHLELSVTEQLAKKILSLPLGIHLSQKEIEAVAKEIKGFYVND